jgi:2,4-dienoyl-CoA reductase-like NADH-dependent reductase (Old Yellow Enzyme family)
MSSLFSPIVLRSVTARNRIAVSPMCQYSAVDGLGNDWHIQNLGAKAAGGAGIVCVEATHVSPDARITPGCLGLWNDAQTAFAARLAGIITQSGAVPAIQIAHAGRKASCARPWEGGAQLGLAEGGWPTVGPTAVPFQPDERAPAALDDAAIETVIARFGEAAARARRAGFQIVEVHAAHGYLLHEFLSPLTNTRDDSWGGDAERRGTLLMRVIDAVRAEWPAELPLFVRVSASDWAEGGLTIDDTVALARRLAARGDVDLIDCSSGGLVPDAKIATGPGYQVPFAEAVRRGSGLATGAVGMIDDPQQAQAIIDSGQADLVLLARALLADPAWPLRAAKALGAKVNLPPQYLRAHLS